MSGRTQPRPRPEGNGASLPDRLPPQSIDAEQSVLGAALISTKAAEYLVSHLKRGDFYLEPHRKVFDVIQHLISQEQPVDMLSVPEELRRRNELEAVGGIAYISTLENSVPTAAHVEFYAEVVLKKSALRKAIHTGGELIARAYEEQDDLDALIGDTTDALISIADRRAGPTRRVFNATDLVAEEMPEPVYIVPGLLTEGMYLLVGKAKQGKSWLAYQIAIAIASGGRALGVIPVERGRVLYLALEDTKRRLKKRLVKLLGEDPVPELLDLAIQWRRANDGGIAELDAYCRKHHPRLIVIDVFGKFRPVREKSAAGIYLDDYADISGIKDVADRHGCTVLLIHHQNKGKDLPDVTDSFSGSTGLSGAVDGWLVLKRERGQPYARLEVDGRDIEEPRELALEWDPRTIWTLKGDAQQYLHTREEQEVISLLQTRGEFMQRKALATALGVSVEAAGKRLQRMEERGLLISDRTGFYGLHPSATEQNGQFHVRGVQVSGVRTCPDPRLPPEREDDLILFPDSADSLDTSDSADTPDTNPPDPEPDWSAFLAAEAELRMALFAWGRKWDFPELYLSPPAGESRRLKPGFHEWRRFSVRADMEWVKIAAAQVLGEHGDG